MSPDNFTQDHFLKIEWLFVNITAVEFPDRGERAILGMVLSFFWPIQATFVAVEPLCVVGVPSWAIITLLRII